MHAPIIFILFLTNSYIWIELKNVCNINVWGYIKILPILFLKVTNDHRNKFSNWSNWKEEAWKIRASTGFEPMTSALPVCCSTNWAMKPNIGSKVLIHMFTWEMKGAQCREAVLVNFWCHFEEILISTFSIAVSQNQVVCGVYMYICAVLQCCHPPYAPFRDDWLLTQFPWILNIFNHTV